mgnify:CR=1 FL=1
MAMICYERLKGLCITSVHNVEHGPGRIVLQSHNAKHPSRRGYSATDVLKWKTRTMLRNYSLYVSQVMLMNPWTHLAMSEHTLINLHGPPWTTNHWWWMNLLWNMSSIEAREHVCTRAQSWAILTNACAQTSRNSKASLTARRALVIP